MKSRLIVRDKGYKNAIKAIVEETRSYQAQAGIDDPEIVPRALANEFGTARQPARSFIRSTLIEREAAIAEVAEVCAREIAEGTIAAKDAMQNLADFVVTEIQGKIMSDVPPQNADSTVKQKGHSLTLVDSGDMLRAVKGKVTRR